MISRSTTQLEAQPVNANDMWCEDALRISTSILVCVCVFSSFHIRGAKTHRSEKAKERTGKRKNERHGLIEKNSNSTMYTIISIDIKKRKEIMLDQLLSLRYTCRSRCLLPSLTTLETRRIPNQTSGSRCETFRLVKSNARAEKEWPGKEKKTLSLVDSIRRASKKKPFDLFTHNR